MKAIVYTTATEAVQLVQSGNRVFIHGSAATPTYLVAALQDRWQELQNVELVSITTLGQVNFDRQEPEAVSFLTRYLFPLQRAMSRTVNTGIMCPSF